jgi:hypothetical protein
VVPDEIERGNAVVIAGDSFAVDDAGARAQPGERINDQREAAGEVIARTAIEPHLRALLACNDSEAVVLISCSHWLPDGSLSVLVGRHGAMNPAGKVRAIHDDTRVPLEPTPDGPGVNVIASNYPAMRSWTSERRSKML